MALNHQALAGSDDEEDLEFLRLAALKSLKKTTTAQPVPIQKHQNAQRPPTFGSAQPTRNHRGFRGGNNRGRNGAFPRGRPQNTNLISIRTVDSDSENVTKEIKSDEIPKLILPQDRYHKVDESKEMEKETNTNKFSRYDNSDKSDSESDEDNKRNEREDSLERLMDLLDGEINERTDKPIVNKSEPIKNNTSDSENKEADSVLIIQCENEFDQEETEDIQVKPKTKVEIKRSKSREKSPVISRKKSNSPKRFEPVRRSRSRSPPRKKQYYKSRSPENTNLRPNRLSSRSPPRKKPYLKDYSPSPRNDYYSSISRSPPRNLPYTSDIYRPLSPLKIDHNVLSLTRAPLSPRSAAFVLQNREILARRKMSPRKSLSPRRSMSPRRSLSPRRRSRSPRFEYNRSLSPRGRSPRHFSPKRRSTSPRRNRRSPERFRRASRSPPGNKPIHKRLGTQRISPSREKRPEPPQNKRTNRSMSLSLSPSPDRSYNRQPLNDTTGLVKERNQDRKTREKPKRESPEPKKELDPILEARRRKFENPVPLEANGIIKLNLKKDSQPKTPENDENTTENLEQIEEHNSEEDIDDLLDINPTNDDLWSEEESDNENEGRFKTKPTQTRTVTCLPFSKLTEKPPPPKKPVLTTKNERNQRSERKRNRNRSRKEQPKEVKPEKLQKIDVKSRIGIDKNNGKIDKNKLASNDKIKETVKEETKPVKEIRKIEISEEERELKELLDDYETEIIVEFDDEDEEEVKEEKKPEIKEEKKEKEDTDNDLRAELSRRRAQRMHKGPPSDLVPARLLSTALKDVGMKRPRHSKIDKSMVLGTVTDRKVQLVKRPTRSSESPEINPKKDIKKEVTGRLPIHMRLGLNANSDIPIDDVLNAGVRERRKKKRRKLIQV